MNKDSIRNVLEPKRELTAIILTWLGDTFPKHVHNFGFSSYKYDYDEINVCGHLLLYVFHDAVITIPDWRTHDNLSDPRFFNKLKVLVSLRINDIQGMI